MLVDSRNVDDFQSRRTTGALAAHKAKQPDRYHRQSKDAEKRDEKVCNGHHVHTVPMNPNRRSCCKPVRPVEKTSKAPSGVALAGDRTLGWSTTSSARPRP